MFYVHHRAWGLWGLCLGLFVLPACGGKRDAGPIPAAPTKTLFDWFAIKVGKETVQMQLAILSSEQEHGLMERRDLGPDQGMLFVYKQPQGMSYWMHDTPTPLDIGYFGPDGELKEIYPMYPFDERPVKSRSDDLQFALEMNQGWYSAHGIRAGAKLDLAALKKALVERGFKPEHYGLR